MSFTLNNVQATLQAAATSATVSISIAAGHTVVVQGVGHGGDGSLGVFTDSAGNTYTPTSATTLGSDVQGGAYSLAIASAITSVTYTPGGTATSVSLMVWDVTCTGTISYADSKSATYNSNAPNSTDGISSGSMTLTSTDGFIVAATRSGFSSSISAGTGFTADTTTNFSGFAWEHKAVSASTAATFTTPTNNDFVQVAAIALQASSAAALAGNAVDVATAAAALRQTHALAGAAQDVATGFGSLYPLTKLTSIASANTLTANPMPVAGDLVELLSVTGGLITDVTINADLTYDWLDGVTGFIYRVYDSSDGSWGLPALQNTQAVTGLTYRASWGLRRENSGRTSSLDILRKTNIAGVSDTTSRDIWIGFYGFSSQAPAAALASAAQAMVTAAAALSTAIKLAGTAANSASAAGALSTGIPLAGAAVDSATATASLSTAIKLAVNAVANATASGALTTAILIAGTASDVVTGSGSLSTGGGAAALAGTAADNVLATGLILTGIAMAGSAVDVVTASGAIVTGIPLLGAAQDVSTATGTLTTTPGFAGSAVTVMTASGAIVTGIPISGAAVIVATSSGALTAQIRLAAAAQSVATAVASLNAQIQLSGAAIDNALATGSLSGGALLAGAAQIISIATVELTTIIKLLVSATAQASAAGTLSTGVQLGGAANTSTTAIGTLSTNAAALVGAAQDIITAIGILTSGIALAGNAQAVSASSAAINTSVRLMGAAQSTVTMSAVLGSAAVIKRLPVYCVLADLIKRFSEGELLQLTDRQQTGSIDLVVVNRAMLDADAKINGYLQGRYSLPMPRVPRVLNLYACEITRYRLYDDRATEQVVKRYKAAIRFLTMVGKGAISLGVDATEQPAVISSDYSQAAPRVFTTDTLKDFKS